jgi:formylglycine-generating enzyme required for sulfatase activity
MDRQPLPALSGFCHRRRRRGRIQRQVHDLPVRVAGSSFLTPAGHARPTYRNFFHPSCRWMAAGLRLARGGGPQ